MIKNFLPNPIIETIDKTETCCCGSEEEHILFF